LLRGPQTPGELRARIGVSELAQELSRLEAEVAELKETIRTLL
jgi:uncharacterized protein YceH (UPF0502 family)